MLIIFFLALMMIPFAIVMFTDWRLVVGFWVFMFSVMLVWKLISLL